MIQKQVLSCSSQYAWAFLDSAETRSIAATTGVDELRRRLIFELPEVGVVPTAIIVDLVD